MGYLWGENLEKYDSVPFPFSLPSPLRFQSAPILRQDTQFSNSAGYANYNDILAVKNLRDSSYPAKKKEMRMVFGETFQPELTA